MPTRLKIIIFFICSVLTSAHAWDFPPVNPAELKITSLPSQPGASAYILAHEEIFDDNIHFHSIYYRIKILTEAGRERADVPITYDARSGDLGSIKARTIHSDGTIIPFEGKPLEKVIYKAKDLKGKMTVITLPDVQVGSVIEFHVEYRYDDDRLYPPRWTLQEDMFQQAVHFEFRPYTGAVRLPRGGVSQGYSWTWNTPNNEQPIRTINNVIAINLNNVPPFVQDEFLPPSDVLKYYVYLYYQTTLKANDFWKEEGDLWSKAVNHFASPDSLRGALGDIIAFSDTPEEKVRKLYEYVQKLENTTYLPTRSDAEKKTLGLKENKKAIDTLRQKSGDRDEITRLFIGLVRAAGIPAYAMVVPSRDTSIFLPQLMDAQQLDHEIAIVQLNGKELYLDPGTRFCPYGLVYWKYTAARGLRQTPDGKTTISESEISSFKDAQIRRLVNLKVTDVGQAEGTIQVGFLGQEAVTRRLAALGTDNAGRIKTLEDEAKTWLPENTEVELTNQPDWNGEAPLQAVFQIKAPLLISAGKRLLMPAHLLVSNRREPMPHAERKYPVYFQYPYTEIDEIHIQLPPSMQVESLPKPAESHLEYAAYNTSYSQNARGLVMSRQLVMGGNIFPVYKYKELRDFYHAAHNSDQQQILLKAVTHASGN